MRCLNCHHDGIPPTDQYCIKCGAHLPSLLRDVLPNGTRLKANTYQIDCALGRGGFGITYRAHHAMLEQTVAIKEYYPQELANRIAATNSLTVPQNKQDIFQRWLQRFVREGRILAKLNHPSLVRVQDLFEESGTAYLVMELLAGRTLGQELEAQLGRKLSPQRVREIVEALVSALDVVHQAGVYHLDIKPDNVLIAPDGRVVLIDFGAAKQAIATSNRTRSTLAYTPNYAPLELISNLPLGPESDIFELGMMLHEMLTGTLPETALSRMMGVAWNADLEEPWQSLVTAALVLEREKRPKSLREWWNSANFGQTVPSPIPKIPSPAPKVASPIPKIPSPAPKVASPAPKIPSLPAATLRGYFVLPELKQQGIMRRLGRGTLKNISPLNDELVIIVCADGGATLLRLSSGKALWEIDCPANCGAVSANGTLLALGGYREIYLWDLRSGQLLWQLSGHEDLVNSVAFSPDGKLLASASKDNTVCLWEVASGKQLRQLRGHEDLVNSVAFSPDGKLLASASKDNIVCLWEVASGKQLRQLRGHTDSVISVVFSPDGKLLASGNGDKTARLWEVASGKQLRQLSGHTDSVISVAFSPDGKFLASGSWDKTVQLWEVASGKQLRQLSGHIDSVISVAFSPDGKFLASGSWDKTVRLWEVASGNQLRQLSGHEDMVYCVAFSPDGKFLASGSRDRSVRLWEVASGKKLRQLSAHGNWVMSVAFCPDGQLLASAGADGVVRLWRV